VVGREHDDPLLANEMLWRGGSFEPWLGATLDNDDLVGQLAWGYANLLEALADPRHERHEEFMEWCGKRDPEAIDAAKATRAMRSRSYTT
jgi:hypothetical protein